MMAAALQRRTLASLSGPLSKRHSQGSTAIGLRSIDATDLRRGPSLPASIVEIEGLPAPIWIPAATTSLQRRPFQLYLSKLRRLDAFEGAKQTLNQLEQLQERPASLSSSKPRVAIVVSHPQMLLPGEGEHLHRLAEIVRANGGEPILVPPLADVLMPSDRKEISRRLKEYLKSFDALIGPGGADVHPRIYHETNTHSVRTNYVRDRFEAEFLRAAIGSECFVLGICRSHQLINAALGGKLVQDVLAAGFSSVSRNQDDFGIPDPSPLIARDETGAVIFEHRVRATPGSDFAHVLGDPKSVLTNSFHHQTVVEPGAGLAVVGKLKDPITGVETVEACEGRNVLTTQFHPESMTGDPQMKDLVGTAARRAHVFQLKKRLTSEGKTSKQDLIAAMHAAPAERFIPADYTWVETKLYLQ